MRPQNGAAVSHMEIEKTDLVLYRQHLRHEVLKSTRSIGQVGLGFDPIYVGVDAMFGGELPILVNNF